VEKIMSAVWFFMTVLMPSSKQVSKLHIYVFGNTILKEKINKLSVFTFNFPFRCGLNIEIVVYNQ
jgi:hypothetical protein